MSFWLPEHQPDTVEKRVKKPPKRPTSPMTGAPLKLKELTTINLPAAAAATAAAAGKAKSSAPASAWQCSVTRKTITVQASVVHKATGALMLESAAKELGYGASELVKLKRPVTGFASTGKVEAKVWRPGKN